MAILSILLSSVFVIYERTSDNVITETMQQRGLAVAQRQMEILIATRQEPESDETDGWDDFDPMFHWHLTLGRESFGAAPPKPNLSNTVIKAVVTVEWDDLSEPSYDEDDWDYDDDDFDDRDEFEDDWEDDYDEGWEEDWERDAYDRDRGRSNRFEEASNMIELVRYFEHDGFKPIAGEPIAVPLTRETPPPPQWYMDLVDRLGREPTPEEVIQQLLLRGEISEELAEGMEINFDDEADDEGTDDAMDEEDFDSMSAEELMNFDLENVR